MASRCRGNSNGWAGFECATVADEGPEHVQAPACECQDGLGVPLAFCSLAFVEPPGFRAASGGDVRGEVEDAQQAAAVAAGPAQDIRNTGRGLWHMLLDRRGRGRRGDPRAPERRLLGTDADDESYERRTLDSDSSDGIHGYVHTELCVDRSQLPAPVPPQGFRP